MTGSTVLNKRLADIAGVHEKSKGLSYHPGCWPHSLTTSSHHVFVVEVAPCCLHIHTHEGEEVATLGAQQLSLMSGEEVLQVAYGHGGFLHATVVNNGNCTRIITYKVRGEWQ